MMLGNLTINEIEKRLGVDFPMELKGYMKENHQAKAENIKNGFWHCFDIPFTLVCGDMGTADKIFSYLKPLQSGFKSRIEIAISSKQVNLIKG